MRRIFKTRSFVRWMRKTELTNEALRQAVQEMASGLIDADLGGHVLKKRVALPGRGKRGSARTLVATNRGDKWFFVFGFEKNERANIAPDELLALQLMAQDLLKLSAPQLDQFVAEGKIEDISDEN
ncbi:MAG: type II toxin-antitoxin system RelE/ParE family toxin [Hydrogenophilales bacterium]|nr:type II toxin-antitoxin system RelE/ParE family toxin [Hydrogenophilales bacterium]